jgi:hypothetical protein
VAAWLMAGEVAARLAGSTHSAGARSRGDEEQLREALGSDYSASALEAARQTARAYVQRDWPTVRALAAALLASGRVEGARLQSLLAGVSRRAA